MIDETTIFKVLDGRKSRNGGTATWQKGRWKTVKGPLKPCVNGLHLCRGRQVLGWLGPDLWVAEFDGGMIDHDDKLVVRRARIVEHLDGWDERTARLFAADCAEVVLPIFERDCPNDGRPREAIRVARAFARGEASRDELAAAGAAASDAVWDAACAAAWDAARAAASAAAWDAAWDAASDAAQYLILCDYLNGVKQ